MIREKITVIEVIEVKKGWIEEKINAVQYGYNQDLFDEELLEALRNCIQGKEVK